jgi:hypothetical protein
MIVRFPLQMRWLFPVVAGEAMRDGDDGFSATGESGKLQCDEGSEKEFTEVHDCQVSFVNEMSIFRCCRGSNAGWG